MKSNSPLLLGSAGALAGLLIVAVIAMNTGCNMQAPEPAQHMAQNETSVEKSTADAAPPDPQLVGDQASSVDPKNAALAGKLPGPFARWTFEKDASDALGSMHGALKSGALVEDGRLLLNGKGASFTTEPAAVDIGERTLEAWVCLPDVNLFASVMQIRDSGGDWDGILFAEQQRKKWYPGSSSPLRSRNLAGPEENAKLSDLIQVAIVYRANNSISMYRNGKIYGLPFAARDRVATLRTLSKNRWFIQLGGDIGNERSAAFEVEEARLYNRALSANEIAESYRIGVELSKQDSGDLAADRRAAEYALSVSGKVRLRGFDHDLSMVAQLPSEPFRLEGIYLTGRAVTDAGLAALDYCTNLKVLNLDGCNVGDAGMAYLNKCTKLRTLNLARTRVGDAGLANFKDCRKLTDLLLAAPNVGDAGLTHLKDLTTLTRLELGGTRVTDKGLENFKDNKNLEFLNLSATKVRGPGLESFKDCMSLTNLDLSGTQVGDPGLAWFKDCKNLVNVNLGQSQVSDAGLAYLSGCKRLSYLKLADTRIGDPGLTAFKDCKTLIGITLNHTQVSDAGMANFKGCRNLQYINVDDCAAIGNAGLAWLDDCKGLRSLQLRGTNLNGEALTRLKGCKNLKLLMVRESKISAAEMDALKQALPMCRVE